MAQGLDPVRLRILDEIESRFKAVREGLDEHVVTWNTVSRDPLSDIEEQLGDALSIIEGQERKSDEVSFRRVILELVVEFQIRLLQGDVASRQLNLVLADIQRTLAEDPHLTISTTPLCQLTIDIRETRNELDIEGADDRVVGGIIAWDVIYRHQVRDPRKLVGE